MERKKDIELLFRQHYRPLCLFALHLINDVASAEDIVMDCYLKLWTKWKEEEIKNPKSYLYIAVRNACYYNPQNEMFPPRKTKCSKSKTKCLRFRHPPKPYKNSVRTAFLPNSNAISISTYQYFILSKPQGSPYQRTSSRNP